MKRALMAILVLSCGCARTLSARNQSAQGAAEDIVARCRLVGAQSDHPGHAAREPVLDEKTTSGPTRVIWLHPPTTYYVSTEEGFLYKCDRLL